jgi:hypothetical protein
VVFVDALDDAALVDERAARDGGRHGGACVCVRGGKALWGEGFVEVDVGWEVGSR